jgi:hypothetical protein
MMNVSSFLLVKVEIVQTEVEYAFDSVRWSSRRICSIILAFHPLT